MSPSLDPAEAQQALATVAEQRRRVIAAAGPPWWIWLVTFVVLVGVGVSQDLGARVQQWVSLAVPLAVLAWIGLVRLSPASAARAGQGMRARRGALMPRRWHALILAVFLAGSVAVVAAGRGLAHWLARAGVPAWAVHHPHTVAGVAVAAVLIGLGWLTDQALNARAGGTPS
jgi:hypothetical protein